MRKLRQTACVVFCRWVHPWRFSLYIRACWSYRLNCRMCLPNIYNSGYIIIMIFTKLYTVFNVDTVQQSLPCMQHVTYCPLTSKHVLQLNFQSIRINDLICMRKVRKMHGFCIVINCPATSFVHIRSFVRSIVAW